MIEEINSIKKNVDYKKLSSWDGNRKHYDFTNFKTLKELIKGICDKNMTIDVTERKLDEFAKMLDALKAYPAKKSKYVKLKENLSKYAKIFYGGWEKTIYGFKNEILPVSKKDDLKTDQQLRILGTPEQTKFNDFLEQIKEDQKNIDMRLSSKYFPYRRSDKMVHVLYDSKSKADNTNETNLIDASFDYFAKKVKEMLTGTNKKEEI